MVLEIESVNFLGEEVAYSAMGMRSWSMLSLLRTVTLSSSKESKSTVTQ